MREDSYIAPKWFMLLLIGLLTGLTACITDRPVNVGAPQGFNSGMFGGSSATNGEAGGSQWHRLNPGDTIKVEFSVEELKPIETEIKQDGTIFLAIADVSFKVAGLTAQEAQEGIRNVYVPKLYRRLGVTITTGTRFFYVGGEVNQEGRIAYSGHITATRAIQAAGGFGTFANRKKVQVTRSSGQVLIIDCVKALRDPRLDVEIFPGDTINVPESPI